MLYSARAEYRLLQDRVTSFTPLQKLVRVYPCLAELSEVNTYEHSLAPLFCLLLSGQNLQTGIMFRGTGLQERYEYWILLTVTGKTPLG